MPSLLVTNDFPPKLGGIQSYLYELWRRLPADETAVFTTAHAGATAWDAGQAFRVVRSRRKVLLPTRVAGARSRRARARDRRRRDLPRSDAARSAGSGRACGSAPYVVVAHGAEITVPGAVPGLRHLGRRVLRGAAAVVAAGGYPARQATRVAGATLPGVVVPPGRRRRAVPPARRGGAPGGARRVRTRSRPSARARVVAARSPQGLRRGDRRGARSARRAARARAARAATSGGWNGARSGAAPT